MTVRYCGNLWEKEYISPQCLWVLSLLEKLSYELIFEAFRLRACVLGYFFLYNSALLVLAKFSLSSIPLLLNVRSIEHRRMSESKLGMLGRKLKIGLENRLELFNALFMCKFGRPDLVRAFSLWQSGSACSLLFLRVHQVLWLLSLYDASFTCAAEIREETDN